MKREVPQIAQICINAPKALWYRIFRALVVCTCSLAVIAIFCGAGDADRSGPVLRRPASDRFRIVGANDLPAQIVNAGNQERVWAIRAPAQAASLVPAIGEACQFILDAPGIVTAALEGDRQKPRLVLAPLLALDGASEPQLLTALSPEHGDVLDSFGKPLRWHFPDNVLAGYNKPRPQPLPALEPLPRNPQYERALARLAPAAGARAYRSLVESHARRYRLNADLVMAIIHSESNFAPNLVSPKSAMGLMQLLPSTASGEVHHFLYGKRGQVSFAELSQPEINIRYGTAYLHILHSKYFNNVRDAQVREACVIASYNMGPNGFLKLYGPTPQAAIAAINNMSAQEFYEDLPGRLPMRETRFYVEKVRRMKQHYAGEASR